MTDKSKLAVWIELPAPKDEAQAQEICALANTMLRRLNGGPSESEFFRMDGRYAYGGQMGYVECPDNGHWFNLRHLGRAL